MKRFTRLNLLIVGFSSLLFASRLCADDLKVDTVFLRLSEDVDVPARAPGVLVNLNVTEGQSVARGEMLGQIEDAEQKLEAERKRFDLEMARKQVENRAALEYALKEVAIFEEQLARAKNSRESLKSSISLKEIEELKLAYERAALDVQKGKYDLEVANLMRQVKQSEVALAEQQIERRRVQSPASGIVSTIDRQAGEWVQPGERVLRIVRLDLLRAEGFIDAREALDNIAGSTVTVTVDGPANKSLVFEGKLVFIDPEVEPATGQVRVRAEIANSDLKLRPGMRASMVIHKGTAVPTEPPQADVPDSTKR